MSCGIEGLLLALKLQTELIDQLTKARYNVVEAVDTNKVKELKQIAFMCESPPRQPPVVYNFNPILLYPGEAIDTKSSR